MQNDNSIVNEIFQGLTFSEKEIKIIASVLHQMTIKKGTILLNAGDVADNMYYISNGCLRSYVIDKHGKKYTMQFAIKDAWIADFTAFFSGSNALLNLEALQDATIYKLSAKDKALLGDEIPQIQQYINKRLEVIYSILQKRIIANLSQTVSEQYINFIASYPDIEKNVKNYHIASYLGITTESLSRIRKDLYNS